MATARRTSLDPPAEALAASVFTDRAAVPAGPELDAVLGPAVDRWRLLRARADQRYGPLQAGWSFGGARHGWSLRLRRGDRVALYLTPLHGTFRASLAIPERAMPAALEADLTEPARGLLAAAPSYPEGRAFRLEIGSDTDIENVLTLAGIRLAHR